MCCAALADGERRNNACLLKYRQLWDEWCTLLASHYDALTYGLISPACREWMWATQRGVLLVALGMGLAMERLALNKGHGGMGLGVAPQAFYALRSEAVLFASDAQLYGVQQQEMLEARVRQLREVTLTQAKVLVKKQFEF